jgi:hypothetical protein
MRQRSQVIKWIAIIALVPVSLVLISVGVLTLCNAIAPGPSLSAVKSQIALALPPGTPRCTIEQWFQANGFLWQYYTLRRDGKAFITRTSRRTLESALQPSAWQLSKGLGKGPVAGIYRAYREGFDVAVFMDKDERLIDVEVTTVSVPL